MSFGLGTLTPDVLAELAEHPQDRAERERAQHIATMDAEDREPDGRHRDWDRMADFVSYDIATGRILGHGRMSLAAIRHEAEQYEKTGFLLAVGEPDTHWVDQRRPDRPARLRLKSRCPARVEGSHLLELPVPCRLTITDEVGDVSEHECDTGWLDLSGSDPGAYQVTVECVPHLTETFSVTVPA